MNVCIQHLMACIFVLSTVEEIIKLVRSKSPSVPLCKGGLRGISPNIGRSNRVWLFVQDSVNHQPGR